MASLPMGLVNLTGAITGSKIWTCFSMSFEMPFVIVFTTSSFATNSTLSLAPFQIFASP